MFLFFERVNEFPSNILVLRFNTVLRGYYFMIGSSQSNVFSLSIYLFIRAEGGLSFRSSQIVLLVAILLYTGGKYLFRPNWFAALPLPRDLPQYLADWAIYTVPFLITGAAGLVTWFYVKRRPSATLLLAFAIFAGTDALLTLLIYVPGMLAE